MNTSNNYKMYKYMVRGQRLAQYDNGRVKIVQTTVRARSISHAIASAAMRFAKQGIEDIKTLTAKIMPVLPKKRQRNRRKDFVAVYDGTNLKYYEHIKTKAILTNEEFQRMRK